MAGLGASASGGALPGAGGTLGGSVDTLGGGAGGTLGATKKSKTDGFRAQNVRHLQDSNANAVRELEEAELARDEALVAVNQWEDKKAQILQDFKKLKQEREQIEDKCQTSTAEIHRQEEKIRVLGAQNRELLDTYEQEEKTCKEKEANEKELSDKQSKLQKISDQYDRIKETGAQQMASAHTEIAKMNEDLRNSRAETEQLKEAAINLQQQAEADIGALSKKLTDAKETNVTHLQQIQHNEVFEHRLADAIHKLKETLEELTVQKKGIKMQVETDVEHRDKWTQSKAEVERRKENMGRVVQALRQSLRSAEETNTRMQEENRAGADNFRQLGDKVYALMDQLRTNQNDLKRQESAGVDKSKKLAQLDKLQQKLQGDLEMEVDAKLAAEGEARQAAQMQALLQKKNKMLDEALALALKAQEKVEKRLMELHEKANALSAQNEYLGTRIDGNEEDKGALRFELRRVDEELRQQTAIQSQLVQRQTELADHEADINCEKESLRAELDYIKREDMLDETGRTKPILIESESKLIERLQINEFLYSAQQARNPVPMMVEKISQILDQIHTAQSQSDQYLHDLQRSNSMLTALRQKNMTLYEKVQMCETWKMRALLKIAANEFEQRVGVKGHHQKAKNDYCLYLDGLQYTNKELTELHKVIGSYGKQDQVKEIHLQDNSLDVSAVPLILSLLDLCPYVTLLDLKRNKLDHVACDQLKSYVERIPGVTNIQADPVTGNITAKSGAQVRIFVNVEEQSPPDPSDPLTSNAARDDLMADDAGGSADKFLASAAGGNSAARLQGPQAMGETGARDRGLLPPQRAGLNQSTSLPRIPSASPAGGYGGPVGVGPGSGRPGSGRR